MSKFRYLTTTLNFTTGIYGPSFPAQEGLALHSYITEKPFYTITTRKHGTTAFAWQTNGTKQTDRDTIEDFWYTTLTEGYDNFTIIDHRKRMLFEASWNDWIERWSKRNGGTYDITYQIESPIPWTLSTFGIYPMIAAALTNHNLSGDDLTASNGSYVQNSGDANVLRLNGYAVKMEGDGSSSGLLGATGTVEWSRTTKHNHITLFFQFMADAVLQTGNLAILEVTHSSNVFRIAIKKSSAIALSVLDNQASSAGADVIVDVTNSIIITAPTDDINTHTYNPSTGIMSSQISTQDPGAVGITSIGVDLTGLFVFVGDGAGVLHSYTYDTEAAISEKVDTLGTGFTTIK